MQQNYDIFSSHFQHSSNSGVLPLPDSTFVDSPADTSSHLHNFMAAFLGDSSHGNEAVSQKLQNFVAPHGKPPHNYSYGDTGNDNYDVFDITSGQNQPSGFSIDPIQVVLISGTIEIPPFWSFEDLIYKHTDGGSAPRPCNTKGSDAIDWHVIEGHEANETRGYVPKNAKGVVLGHSGVTIASGLDLGQHNITDLNNLKLADALIKTLKPYLSLTGTDATKYLAAHQLDISASDATSINSAIHSETLNRLIVAYDNAVGANNTFFGLPAGVQTAIADLAFQYQNLAISAPNFWKDVTKFNWTDAVSELKNFKDLYPTRRSDEAKLIQSAIDNKQISNSHGC